VNFSFSAEQDTFRAEARRFLSERVDVRAQIALPGAHDPGLWKEMASLGWLGFGIPESEGGQESSLVDVCILLEETGRALLPGPLLPHTIASLALARAGTKDPGLLRAMGTGETIAGCTESLDAPVPCGAVVDDVVLLRFMEPAIARAGTFEAVDMESADLTRPCARITLNAGAEPLDKPTPLLPVACVPLAAESVGAAASALDMATSYAKDRQQFGRAIGSFQAIKHKAADMLRALEAARLTVYYAASAIDAGDPDAHVAAAMAKVAANDAFMRCSAENIQIHGGIGVTWEHDAHLFYRRALASSAMFGESSGGRDLVARSLFAELG
jgi:alkylation response protein AidB-like acyl-CoA dehydrogenase